MDGPDGRPVVCIVPETAMVVWTTGGPVGCMLGLTEFLVTGIDVD